MTHTFTNHVTVIKQRYKEEITAIFLLKKKEKKLDLKTL